jgi:hypothetical protein
MKRILLACALVAVAAVAYDRVVVLEESYSES